MSAAQLAALAGLRCRAVSIPFGPGPPALDVLGGCGDDGDDGLIVLHGVWGGSGGGAIVAAQPLLVLAADDPDPIAALGVLPQVESADAAVIGGGWFGSLAYEGCSTLAFYDHLLRLDDAGHWWFEALWSAGRDAVLRARRRELQSLLGPAAAPPSWRVGAFGGASRSRHLASVERAQELIRAGEIYQVNVCTRLDAEFQGRPVGAFAAAVDALRPAFGAFIGGAERAVISLSPELFLRRRGRAVTTSPIKGTWPSSDPAAVEALRHSAKERAENVMIVDLMRNDLGRVSEPGSVQVPALFDVQRHPGVWHLVSTVTGALRPTVDDATLVRAVFPPGSVTGVPKIRAMAAIADVEAGPRGVYTGAIGYVSPCFGAEFSVAIRTFEVSGDRIELGVGGGVTADSVPMLEWQECLHKATPLLSALRAGLRPSMQTSTAEPTAAQHAGGLLETVLVLDRVPLRLGDHLARLDRSGRELFGRGAPPGLAADARGAASGAGPGRAVLRVHLDGDGGATVVLAPATAPPGSSAARSVRRAGGSGRHKWAERSELVAAEAAFGVPLFIGADGAVLETSRGNVFLLLADGALVTPPLRDDLLPGVTRRALLDHARDSGRRVQLRSFGVDELMANPAFWTSSLSGAVPLSSLDGVEMPRWDDEIAALAHALLRGGDVPIR